MSRVKNGRTRKFKWLINTLKSIISINMKKLMKRDILIICLLLSKLVLEPILLKAK